MMGIWIALGLAALGGLIFLIWYAVEEHNAVSGAGTGSLGTDAKNFGSDVWHDIKSLLGA